MGTFGEKLRKQREQRGLALDAISNTTKISTRMLRALEEEHFDQLPGGVFNKGFVRAYARQVGLDEEEAITDYLSALRESQMLSQQILPDFHNPGAKPRQTPIPNLRQDPSPSDDVSSEKRATGVSTTEGQRNKDQRSADRRSEDRRNEDRRNEVRRIDDRGPTNSSAALSALGTQTRPNGHRDPNAREPQRVNNSAEENHGFDGYHRDRRAEEFEGERANNRSDEYSNDDRDGHSNDDDQRRNGTPSRDISSMPGFITAGAEAKNHGESPDRTSARLTLSRKRQLGATLLLLTIGLSSWLFRRHQEPKANAAVVQNSSSSGQMQSPAAIVPSASEPMRKIEPVSPQERLAAEESTPPTRSQFAKSSPASTHKSAASVLSANTLTAPGGTVPANSTPAIFSLTIRAAQTTWISITADGKPVAHETLIAPAHTSVRATREIAVKVGNAAGVSFALKGKEFPAQGNAGEVKTYVFDSTGLQSPVATDSPNQ